MSRQPQGHSFILVVDVISLVYSNHGVLRKFVNSGCCCAGREVVALGRELLGGNGIVSDFLCAKTFCDMEAYYTYEGTYEVNALVVGREATKIAAFKAPPKRSQNSKPNVQA